MPSKKAASTSSRTKKKTATAKTASSKKRASRAKSKPAKAGDQEVTIDRRRQADRRDPANADSASKPNLERREKVQRRRQIDPTTCERDYSVDEVEFMNAMDEYKRKSGRMFPTCSEVLEVIRGLGYVKLTPAEIAVIRPVEDTSTPAAGEAESTVEADEDFEALETEPTAIF